MNSVIILHTHGAVPVRLRVLAVLPLGLYVFRHGPAVGPPPPPQPAHLAGVSAALVELRFFLQQLRLCVGSGRGSKWEDETGTGSTA